MLGFRFYFNTRKTLHESVKHVFNFQKRLVGLGFVGIAVALMGRNHPFGIVIAALLFGSLFQWGEVIQLKGQFIRPKLDIDKEIVVALQGLVVLFTGALYLMVVWGVQWFARRVLGGWGFAKEEVGEERA